jgi:hypothetical protein
MARITWDISEAVPQINKAAMSRIKEAAELVRDNAKQILRGLVKEVYREHGPYKSRYTKGKSKFENATGVTGRKQYIGGEGSPWTARHYQEMAKTIRVTVSKDSSSRSVWIMAGNYLAWWATQMEYGKGGWRGRRKSFLRPAIRQSLAGIRQIIEG